MKSRRIINFFRKTNPTRRIPGTHLHVIMDTPMLKLSVKFKAGNYRKGWNVLRRMEEEGEYGTAPRLLLNYERVFQLSILHKAMERLRWLSRYSDSLQARRSGIEFLMGRDFPHISRETIGPAQPPKKGHRVFLGGKAVGAWRWPPNPSSPKVEGKIQVYRIVLVAILIHSVQLSYAVCARLKDR
jgi:hypothetical protein